VEIDEKTLEDLKNLAPRKAYEAVRRAVLQTLGGLVRRSAVGAGAGGRGRHPDLG